MQGILQSNYKQVEEYLNKLKEENQTNHKYVCQQVIIDHKEKLHEIYKKYRETFNQMSQIVIQFKEHKLAVKRLVINQKKKKKEIFKLGKHNNIKTIVPPPITANQKSELFLDSVLM